jgi:hypothetical protein
MRKLLKILLPSFFIAISSAYAEPRITLSIGDIRSIGSPALNSKDIQVSLTGPRASVLEIKLEEIVVQGTSWRNLRSVQIFRYRQNFGRKD